MTIGPDSALPVGTSTDTARVGTKSAYDFAYWASTFVATGTPSQYTDSGPETDAVPLIVWAASQTGVVLPNTFTALTAACTATLTVPDALRKRGAVLIGPTRFAVCLGFNDIIDIVNGRYFIRRLNSAMEQAKWTTGATLPGVLY